MLAHDITESGAMPNASIGALDIDMPDNATVQVYSRRGYATEGRFSMWLMYGCPWATQDRQYSCLARKTDAQQSGVNFLANERTLSTEYDVPQVSSMQHITNWTVEILMLRTLFLTCAWGLDL